MCRVCRMSFKLSFVITQSEKLLNYLVVKSSQCTIRFDKPHKGADFHHINIDPQGISSRNNRHIAVPETLINRAAKIDRCLKAVSKGLVIAALIIDGIRILGAIYEDMNDKEHTLPERTITIILEIAGGWAGGAIGATAGALAGAKIGACIGSLFGGIGVVIGAPIGAALGAIFGGIAGGHYGNKAGGFAAGGILGCYHAGLILKGGDLNTDDWDDMFSLSVAVLANPGAAVSHVVKGLNSNDPKEKMKALGAVSGAASGALCGTMIAGPVGTVVGGAVGFTVGLTSSWLGFK